MNAFTPGHCSLCSYLHNGCAETLAAGGAIRREVLSFSQYCWHQIYVFTIATLYGFEYTVAAPNYRHYFSVLVADVCVDLFPTNFFLYE